MQERNKRRRWPERIDYIGGAAILVALVIAYLIGPVLK
jgi:hypothetical protein